MRGRRLIRTYYDWLVGLLKMSDTEVVDFDDYDILLKHLFNTTFLINVYDDNNRSSDGLSLREHYSRDAELSSGVFEDMIIGNPCSVLEMMMGLAIRIEREYLAGDYEDGNRTWLWFYSMLESLGLSKMTDDNYDEEKVNDILYSFMCYEYPSNGRGSLFYIPGKHAKDMTSIWYQAHNWINYICKKGKLHGKTI